MFLLTYVSYLLLLFIELCQISKCTELDIVNCSTIWKNIHCDWTNFTAEEVLLSDQVCMKNSSGLFMNTSLDDLIYVSACVQCYVPHHCLEYNECLPGTTGPTCEKCNEDIGYYRIGNSCAKCLAVPGSAVAFIILLCIIVPMIYVVGFTESVSTKLKQLVNFMQLILITLFIRKTWSNNMLNYLTIFSFANMNSRFLSLECFGVSSLQAYYIQWFTVLLLPIAGVIMLIGDKRLEIKIIKEMDSDIVDKLWKWRNILRRVCVFCFLCCFLPVLTSTLHTFACAETRQTVYSFEIVDIFLLNQKPSITCADPSFQVLKLLLITVSLTITCLGLPVLLFLSIVAYKWNLFAKYYILYGSIFESYKKPFCFWEVVVFLRKFISAFLTDSFPIQARDSCMGTLVVTALYLALVIIGRPYEKYYWPRMGKHIDIHNSFEILANISLLILQIHSLLDAQEKYVFELEVAAQCLIAISIGIWLISFLSTPYEKKEIQMEKWEVPVLKKQNSFVPDWEFEQLHMRQNVTDATELGEIPEMEILPDK